MNGYTPAVFALLRLHAELGGEIKNNRREAKRLAKSMKHVEAVLKLLEPGFNARGIAAKRKNRENPFFKRGTVFRAVVDILRGAPAPMTTREIVDILFRQRGGEAPSVAQVRTMFSAVHSSLRNHQGKTVETVGEGKPGRWRLIDA
jgi:hypothetical protein